MPAYRIGFGSDFVLKDQKVGIGTENPRVVLDVVGTLKGDLSITGVTTLTSYAGFVPQKQLGDDDTITNEVNTISEDIIVSVGKTFTVSVGATVNVGTLESVSIGTHFSPPNGGISLRPEEPVEGMVRFNDDLNTLEFYNGVEWRQFTVTGSSGRGVFMGGSPGSTNIIDYVNIATLGNAIEFGRLGSGTMTQGGACSSATRGLYGGGENPAITNSIEYITLASEGNAIDFGDLSETRRRTQENACSSSTRGIWSGGYNPGLSPASRDTIDYVEIATLGNALDFGNLIGNRESGASCSSATRGIFAGGRNQPANLALDEIQLFTIAAKGNAIEFGELTTKRFATSSCSNSVRGIFAAGNYPVAPVARLKVIDYITIASNGNAIHFGDLSEAIEYPMATAGQTRGLIAGGSNPSASNAIQYITISSTGNAQDFGDLTYARSEASACSDSHGGLGGF